jgi:hypothetical protein
VKREPRKTDLARILVAVSYVLAAFAAVAIVLLT